MKIITTIKELQRTIARAKFQGKTIGFVPTMGYFHDGHLSLMRQSKKDTTLTVVSIFVNPTQFNRIDDLKNYPQNLRRDKLFAKREHVDIIFHPSVDEIYPKGHMTYVDVEDVSKCLCGQFRLGHFKGVATVVAKLINIVNPDVMYLGQKDAQQVVVIKKMVENLNFSVKIKVMPTIRESDGLAMSSRNSRLSSRQRQEVVIVYQSLQFVHHLILQGKRSALSLKSAIKRMIEKNSSARVEYIEFVSVDDLSTLFRLKGRVLVAVAVWFGKTRLIDNITVNIS